jgi:fluoride exporter
VVKAALLVLMGGGVGAVLREYLMLQVRSPSDKFPLDILVANLVAAFLLGFVTGLYRRKAVSDGVNLLVGTGVTGGLSTFSSFAYGTVVLMLASAESAVVASAYVITSLVLGYVAVVLGLNLGRGALKPLRAADSA